MTENSASLRVRPRAGPQRNVSTSHGRANVGVIDGLVLGVLRLREVPGAILPSEKIAEMAKEALAVWKASKQVEWLWRHDPRYKQVLDPKRSKSSFCPGVIWG
jgi:hypothetical protein